MKTKFILYRLAQLANMKWELVSERVLGTVINTSVAFSDDSVYFQGCSILGRVSNLDNNKGWVGVFVLYNSAIIKLYKKGSVCEKWMGV